MISSDKDQIHALSQRILTKCANALGGAEALARHLGISEATLAEWLAGRKVPPVDAIMRAVAPLIGNGSSPHLGQEAPDTGASSADVA